MAALGFGVMLALVGSSQVDASLPGELRQSILRSSFGSATMTTGIIATILCVTVPPRTALQTLLDMLPVSRRDCQLGQLVPLLVVGFVFSLALSATAIAITIKLLPDWLQLTGSIGLVVLTIVIIQAMIVGLFQLLSGALRRLFRLPHQYSVSIAATITIVLSLGSAVGDVFALAADTTTTFELQDLRLNRVMAELVLSPSNFWTWLLLLGWLMTAASLLALSSAWYQQELVSSSITLFRGVEPRHGWLNASMWMEALIGIRTPQAIVTVLAMIPFIVAVKWLLSIQFLADSAEMLALGIPIVPFLLVMYAVGRTLRYRWIGLHLLARETWWVLPKIIAYYLLALTMSSPVLAAELGLSMIAWSDLPNIFARATLAFGAALIGGSLVPYSEEQPLSVTVSGFVSAILYMGASLAMSWLTQFMDANLTAALTAVLALLFLGIFWTISVSQNTDDVRRA
ncbi:hypothetical protein HQQ81_10515 [Microbacteriaceae bacterium VKM Ac-2854]|nr:hypothetical protein [Microbacteriaceae bacterium VKM Ac-2854]